MRTTVTLDPDVAAKVKAEMRRTGDSFKEVINRLARKGAEARAKQSDGTFVVSAYPMGEKPGLNFDNFGELLEQLEGPFHK
jgi:hypothetical protein